MNRHSNMKPYAAQRIALAGSRSPWMSGGGSNVLI
jgi:hypothetical protein